LFPLVAFPHQLKPNAAAIATESNPHRFFQYRRNLHAVSSRTACKFCEYCPEYARTEKRTDPLSPMLGQLLLHYRVVEKIGEGGQGTVYKVFDTTLDRPAVIKVLPPDLTDSASNLVRFEREASSPRR